MTARYAQCDDTCTVDCGHCKGQGRPEVRTADGHVLTPVEAAAHAAIQGRLGWASLHWRTEKVSPDAWPHIAVAAAAGVASIATKAPTFTERQATAWPEAIARARLHAPEVSDDPNGYLWTLTWAEEVRPGRGHGLHAVWCDGERLVEVRMDVYGAPSVAVAEVEWLHSDSNEECGCEPCVAWRAAE